jgi:S-adenosylmethionine decarboxylase
MSLSERKPPRGERADEDEAEQKPTVHPSKSCCSGLLSATSLVVLLCFAAAGVAAYGLTRGSRFTASGADFGFEEDRTGATAASFAPWPHAIPLIGKHWIVEAEGCEGAIINDETAMVRIVREAVASANASLVTIISKGFDHMGVTILALLSESHVGIHTWPQYGYAATDVFTCGHIAQPQVAVHHMIREWKCNESSTRCVSGVVTCQKESQPSSSLHHLDLGYRSISCLPPVV